MPSLKRRWCFRDTRRQRVITFESHQGNHFLVASKSCWWRKRMKEEDKEKRREMRRRWRATLSRRNWLLFSHHLFSLDLVSSSSDAFFVTLDVCLSWMLVITLTEWLLIANCFRFIPLSLYCSSWKEDAVSQSDRKRSQVSRETREWESSSGDSFRLLFENEKKKREKTDTWLPSAPFVSSLVSSPKSRDEWRREGSGIISCVHLSLVLKHESGKRMEEKEMKKGWNENEKDASWTGINVRRQEWKDEGIRSQSRTDRDLRAKRDESCNKKGNFKRMLT